MASIFIIFHCNRVFLVFKSISGQSEEPQTVTLRENDTGCGVQRGVPLRSLQPHVAVHGEEKWEQRENGLEHAIGISLMGHRIKIQFSFCFPLSLYYDVP